MKLAAFVALSVVLAAGGVWLACRNYSECRAHGFSRFYCATDRR